MQTCVLYHAVPSLPLLHVDDPLPDNKLPTYKLLLRVLSLGTRFSTNASMRFKNEYPFSKFHRKLVAHPQLIDKLYFRSF